MFNRGALALWLAGSLIACSSTAESEDSTRASSSTGGGGSGGGGGSPAAGSSGSVGGSAPIIAPDPSGWQATGALSTARALATLSLLPDGRVLVVGGEDDDYAMLDSVELFDPEAGTFSVAATLPEPRDHHTATVLESGEVLVVGGGSGSEISLPNGETALRSAVLYDPNANAWRPTGDMNEARAGHRAVRLADGRVLVVGGGNEVGYSCAQVHPDCTVADSIGSAEVYDPTTEVWTQAAALAQPRIAFDLRTTPSGVVASGGAADNRALDSVEIYDPTSDTWRSGPKLAGQRLYHAAALLGDELVVAGGKVANVSPVTSVDILDAAGSGWTPGASLEEPRTGSSFIALQSGNGLLLAGSNQLGARFLAETSVYDPVADAWKALEPLAEGRYSQAAVLLQDGSVLVVGGRTWRGATTSVERSR